MILVEIIEEINNPGTTPTQTTGPFHPRPWVAQLRQETDLVPKAAPPSCVQTGLTKWPSWRRPGTPKVKETAWGQRASLAINRETEHVLK